ncbi:MAG: purine-nucleoside phosphorylase [Acidobacteria bacterium RIFCSPLOWO2_12_FULL_67_14]|nr:MAG: purine-nucleoside phosphorylase [Acidobacteria bacterium RIFCSPLOWO2_02_FULL_67_21]OFW39251.1 MAG: purine-nucleoside phosphorylase [Acidobacteria bacterium RIFCSPLOWO2_12_FULL_67_14]
MIVERVEEAAEAIRRRSGGRGADRFADVAIVLGSGLGECASALTDAASIPYDELPHWPVSRVVGHPGRLVVGTLAGRRVAALAGRVHLYEGHDAASVVFATRVMGRLGIARIVLTNAAGGVNTRFAAGALMLIDDHLNLLGQNPLAGENDERLGPRFPDMTEVYSARLRRLAGAAAAARGIDLVHGVYAACPGPSYETPAEIRYLRTIGADAVGMSTVPEAIAARHMGLEVLGISCITNMAAGVLPQPLRHEDVLETARRVRGTFASLLEGIIERL